MCQVADSLEKGTEHEDEYMISEKELLVNRFVNFSGVHNAFSFSTSLKFDTLSVGTVSFPCQKTWEHSTVELLLRGL